MTVASDLATIEDAQRLRYKVFAEELGAELRSGGEPAWDTEFGTADFLMLIGLDRVNGRYARHFALVADDRP